MSKLTELSVFVSRTIYLYTPTIMPLFGNKNMIVLIRLSCDIHNFHNGACKLSISNNFWVSFENVTTCLVSLLGFLISKNKFQCFTNYVLLSSIQVIISGWFSAIFINKFIINFFIYENNITYVRQTIILIALPKPSLPTCESPRCDDRMVGPQAKHTGVCARGK